MKIWEDDMQKNWYQYIEIFWYFWYQYDTKQYIDIESIFRYIKAALIQISTGTLYLTDWFSCCHGLSRVWSGHEFAHILGTFWSSNWSRGRLGRIQKTDIHPTHAQNCKHIHTETDQPVCITSCI